MDPSLGLDGQLSNWAITDEDRLVYLDVSTPLMRDSEGHEALDTDLFLSSLPWALRPVVKRFMLRDILATYYRPRTIIVDFLANLYKEKLSHLLPDLIERANGAIDPGYRAGHRCPGSARVLPQRRAYLGALAATAPDGSRLATDGPAAPVCVHPAGVHRALTASMFRLRTIHEPARTLPRTTRRSLLDAVGAQLLDRPRATRITAPAQSRIIRLGGTKKSTLRRSRTEPSPRTVSSARNMRGATVASSVVLT